MAPPQDERRSARGTPSCSIFSACRNSLRKKSLRLPAKPASPARAARRGRAPRGRNRSRAPRSPARHCPARRIPSRCAPARSCIAWRTACPCAARRSKVGSRRYCPGVCTNSACCGAFSARPGMARSGSVRSGSRPRMPASKVAREMPSFCASGQVDWSHCWKAGSARAGAAKAASNITTVITRESGCPGTRSFP